MASNALNLHLLRQCKNLTSLDNLTAQLFNTKSKPNQKQQLSLLRELHIYFSSFAAYELAVGNDSVLVALLKLLIEIKGDQDADRKLIKVLLQLYTIGLNQNLHHGNFAPKHHQLVAPYAQWLVAESSVKTGMRQDVILRSMGQIVYFYYCAVLQQLPNSIRVHSSSNGVDSSGDDCDPLQQQQRMMIKGIVDKLLKIVTELKYPAKTKKGMIAMKADKDFFPSLLHWTASVSALRRAVTSPADSATVPTAGSQLENSSKVAVHLRDVTNNCLSNLFQAMDSEYEPLVQHALVALQGLVMTVPCDVMKQEKLDQQQLEVILETLSTRLQQYFQEISQQQRQGTKTKKNNDEASLKPTSLATAMNDNLSYTYLLRLIQKITVRIDLSKDSPTREKLFTVYLLVSKQLHSQRVKVVIETIYLLLNHSYCMELLPSLEDFMKVKNTKKSSLIAAIASGLIALLNNTSMSNLSMKSILRACIALGKYLVLRPYSTDGAIRYRRAIKKEGDALVPLWGLLRRIFRHCLLPKYGAVANSVQRAGRTLSKADVGTSSAHQAMQQRQQTRSTGGQALNTGTACGIAPTSGTYWSWSSPDPTVAAGALPDPHLVCELLRAQLWIAPDQRYCREEHRLLWSSLAESFLSAVKIMISSLSDVMDVQILLLPLMTEYFERIKASTFVRTTSSSSDAIMDTNNLMNNFTPSTQGATAAVDDPFGFATLLTPVSNEATTANQQLNAPLVEKRVVYQAVYIDLLIALCEQLVVSMESSAAFALLQQIWGWLTMFSSFRTTEWLPAPSTEGTAAGASTVSLSADVLSSLLSNDTVSAASGMSPENCESHANQALLSSISRIASVSINHQSLHACNLPNAVGISSYAAASVNNRNVLLSTLWQLADKASLCWCVHSGHDSMDSLLQLVNIFSDNFHYPQLSAADTTITNVCIKGMVKIGASVVYRYLSSASAMKSSERRCRNIKVDKLSAVAVVEIILQELAVMYMQLFGHHHISKNDNGDVTSLLDTILSKSSTDGNTQKQLLRPMKQMLHTQLRNFQSFLLLERGMNATDSSSRENLLAWAALYGDSRSLRSIITSNGYQIQLISVHAAYDVPSSEAEEEEVKATQRQGGDSHLSVVDTELNDLLDFSTIGDAPAMNSSSSFDGNFLSTAVTGANTTDSTGIFDTQPIVDFTRPTDSATTFFSSDPFFSSDSTNFDISSTASSKYTSNTDPFGGNFDNWTSSSPQQHPPPNPAPVHSARNVKDDNFGIAYTASSTHTAQSSNDGLLFPFAPSPSARAVDTFTPSTSGGGIAMQQQQSSISSSDGSFSSDPFGASEPFAPSPSARAVDTFTPSTSGGGIAMQQQQSSISSSDGSFSSDPFGASEPFAPSPSARAVDTFTPSNSDLFLTPSGDQFVPSLSTNSSGLSTSALGGATFAPSATSFEGTSAIQPASGLEYVGAAPYYYGTAPTVGQAYGNPSLAYYPNYQPATGPTPSHVYPQYAHGITDSGYAPESYAYGYSFETVPPGAQQSNMSAVAPNPELTALQGPIPIPPYDPVAAAAARAKDEQNSKQFKDLKWS